MLVETSPRPTGTADLCEYKSLWIPRGIPRFLIGAWDRWFGELATCHRRAVWRMRIGCACEDSFVMFACTEHLEAHGRSEVRCCCCRQVLRVLVSAPMVGY